MTRGEESSSAERLGSLAAANGLVLNVTDLPDQQPCSSPFCTHEVPENVDILASTPSRYRFLPWRRNGSEQGQSRATGFIKKSIHNSRLKSLLSGPDVEKIRHAYSLPRSLSSEGKNEQPTSKDSRDALDVERTVLFDDGSSYSGEWKDGKIEGRGVFLWVNGDRFEGEWKEDLQNGQGTFASADGSVYYGGWKNGLKDGDGVYRPARQHGEVYAPILYLRRYEAGKLVKNIKLDISKMKGTKGKMKIHDVKKNVSLDRPLKPGEVIYKGHHSYDLMRQLQLGIMYGIAQEQQEAMNSPVQKSDYSAVLVQNFPSSGSIPGFKYKDYLPRVFQLLRRSFGVDSADYLVSLTGGPALREMPSPGASGCIFFLSEDDRFFIKSVRKEEMGIFLQFMKHYQKYVSSVPGTLLVKFFGIHRVSPWFGNNARFVVMGNVLPTEKRMHRKYDLKGSTYKRTVGKDNMNDPTATLKDLDIDMKFELSSERYGVLMSTLKRDIQFLAKRRLIDYSLLLGVHFISWGENEWYPPSEPLTNPSSQRMLTSDYRHYPSLAFSRSLVQNIDSLDFLQDPEEAEENVKNAANLIASANSVRDAARSSAASANSLTEFSKKPAARAAPSTTFIIHHDGTSHDAEYRGESVGFHSETSIGWATPAMAVQIDSDGSENRQPVLLYFGIIDFLQKYNTRKKIEKFWKRTLHGDTVSVADPKHYADRFIHFMEDIFIDKGDSSPTR